MSGVVDLDRLIATLEPVVRPGEYVFVSLDRVPDCELEAVIREDEGSTCVVARTIADENGWPYDFVAGWITLQVHSALEAVGLTAVVSAALAEESIPANVLAGYFHDHLLVPVDRVDDAQAVLRALTAGRQVPARLHDVRRTPGRRASDLSDAE
jgi:hypothetical protein